MKEKQALEKKMEVNADIMQNNELQKREKEEIARLERIKDREMIQRIVQKERQLAEYEKYMREQEKEEARRILQGMKSRNNEM